MRSKTVSMAIILLAALMLHGTSSGLTFGDEHAVVSDSRDQKDVDMAVAGEGEQSHVHIVYEDENVAVGRPGISFKRSTDSGRTFSSPVSFLDSPDGDDRQLDPSIDVLEKQDVSLVAVAYIDNSPGSNSLEYYLMCSVSFDRGRTWRDPVKITDDIHSGYPNNRMKDTDICIDEKGNIFVVWAEDPHIRISYSTDNGSSWSDPQKVRPQTSPDHPDYIQMHPTVASDGDHVVVAYDVDDYDWKRNIYLTRAEVPSVHSSLSFLREEMLPIKDYPQYKTYYPSIACANGEFSLVWWDFSTDKDGNNDEDPSVDRPSVAYTRSTDGGETWKVGSERYVPVNGTSPVTWHSRATVDVSPSGRVAVSYLNRTSNSLEVYSRTTDDGGLTWSIEARVNEYNPQHMRDPPVVGVDETGGIHVSWSCRPGSLEDKEVSHSRSIVDQLPGKVTSLMLIYAEEREAMVSWDINVEPDWERYRVHISEDVGFTPSEDTVDAVYEDQGTGLHTFTDLVPDTGYHVKIETTDVGGYNSFSDQLRFRTLPVNQPPSFNREIPTIYLEEDGENLEALNLSLWKEMSWISDDEYTGMTELSFDVIPVSPEPNVTAIIRERTLDQPYWLLDVYASKPNWAGTEYFRLEAWDQGKDGGFGTPDDRHNLSEPFAVKVNSTNDPPYWSTFQDLNTGWQTPLPTDAEHLKLPAWDTGCIEGQEYRFAFIVTDIDGDFITYSASDDRIDIGPDNLNPRTRSIFGFTPKNDDVPLMNTIIYADDENGGMRELLLEIPVENVNEPPSFVSIDGKPVSGDPLRADFQTEEGEELHFIVEAEDTDHGDRLDLVTSFDRIGIERISDNEWNVSFDPEEGDHGNSPVSFTLDLYDRMKEHVPLLVAIEVSDRQNPVTWAKGRPPIEIEYTYDLTDPNEKKDTNKLGGPRIQAEWNEPVTLKGNAFDIDGDPITYRWTITDMNGTEIAVYEGREALHSFSPSLRDLRSEEKFRIVLNASDGNFPGIEYTREEFVRPDIDNDNDGMIDELEIKYFGSLEAALPDEDPDNDGLPNRIEIGIDTPAHTDPTHDPSTDDRGNDPGGSSDDGAISSWIIFTGITVVVLILIFGAAFAVMVRISRVKEKREEEDIEKRVKEMDRRQKEISGLYGRKDAEEYFGPDQTTLDDLELDLGGQLYHEEGPSGGLKSGMLEKGPRREAAEEGPLFQEGAPAPSFGDKLDLADDESPEEM